MSKTHLFLHDQLDSSQYEYPDFASQPALEAASALSNNDETRLRAAFSVGKYNPHP
ncbi:hypothetical protein INS49_011693 [Diaporthe citri]|uniref:uncharacterized protein n=1 Tax=Diaporthe citri TaxID=83186 RepID=UPI001C7FD98B|nr:uncharacterized protein INS49_011693 [Diaporthe citri]KAG6360629.1 hypothetical protein INS49_011693 [Diaporthe citri]